MCTLSGEQDAGCTCSVGLLFEHTSRACPFQGAAAVCARFQVSCRDQLVLCVCARCTHEAVLVFSKVLQQFVHAIL